MNRATRGTSFNLVYGADVILPPEIYLQSARVAHLNSEHQAEATELDSILLEERRNTALINVRKYHESLKKYYNMSVVQRELNIGHLVLKKDIRTQDKHKFLSPWEGPFIIVDVAAPGLMCWRKLTALWYPIHGTSISYVNIMWKICA
jgi:hypothetical protein